MHGEFALFMPIIIFTVICRVIKWNVNILQVLHLRALEVCGLGFGCLSFVCKYGTRWCVAKCAAITLTRRQNRPQRGPSLGREPWSGSASPSSSSSNPLCSRQLPVGSGCPLLAWCSYLWPWCSPGNPNMVCWCPSLCRWEKVWIKSIIKALQGGALTPWCFPGKSSCTLPSCSKYKKFKWFCNIC